MAKVAIKLGKDTASDPNKKVGINVAPTDTFGDEALWVKDGAIKTNKMMLPTSSGGTTYGLGSSGQVLKSNGTTIYWATDSNSNTWRAIQVNGTQQLGTGTSTGALNIKNGNGITVSYNSGVVIDHSNSVTAQTTQAVYPIKIDAQGHISAYGTAVTSMTPTSHSHGNITNGGDITVTAPTIANGDQIIINDNSESKITNGPTFDGSTATKCLTQKGTWESFTNNSGTITGSGTSGYLTKWNGSSSITNGPQLGSGTLTFLRNDGTWATPCIGTKVHNGSLPDYTNGYDLLGNYDMYLFLCAPSGGSLCSLWIPGQLIKDYGTDVDVAIQIADGDNYESAYMHYNSNGNFYIAHKAGSYRWWYGYGINGFTVGS